MRSDFITMLHYSRDRDAWLQLTGWDAPATHRDALDALREIERQTDEVLRERGEPEHAPYVLVAGSLASERAPHEVRRAWRLSEALADRLLTQVEGRGVEAAIDDAIADWESEQFRHDEEIDSLDPDDFPGLDLEDLARRAYPPPA
ncbi:MAG TPA: hypothetical protein VEA81_08945 [Burkholderiaceae bacterium]|nr:hypothetical protein [Burkholderiaceae bacterium]